MFRTLFLIGGVVLLAFGLISPFAFPQASLIGVENSLEISNTQVKNPTTASPTYSMSIKNLKTTSFNFITLVEVTFQGLDVDVYKPITMISNSIQASETKAFEYSIKCVIYCNLDGTYRSGIYTAKAKFWQLAESQPAVCQADPLSWECNYIQVAPPIQTDFAVNPPTQATVKILACYQYLVDSPFNCFESVPAGEGSVTPSGSITDTSGSSKTFTATEVAEKSKFAKWIIHGGIVGGKYTETTTNPLTSEIQYNQIYVAIFTKLTVVKPKLSISVTNPTACITTPEAGVHEKNLNDKVTITMTPQANITSQDGKSTHVFAIIGYSITKANSPVPDVVNFTPDNTFVVGSKTAKTTKEITMDVDTTVIVSCGGSDVLKNPNGDPVKPPGTGLKLPGLPSFGLAQIVAIAGGITMLGVGAFMSGGRKTF